MWRHVIIIIPQKKKVSSQFFCSSWIFLDDEIESSRESHGGAHTWKLVSLQHPSFRLQTSFSRHIPLGMIWLLRVLTALKICKRGESKQTCIIACHILKIKICKYLSNPWFQSFENGTTMHQPSPRISMFYPTRLFSDLWRFLKCLTKNSAAT
jgi:hypothetical protein